MLLKWLLSKFHKKSVAEEETNNCMDCICLNCTKRYECFKNGCMAINADDSQKDVAKCFPVPGECDREFRAEKDDDVQ